MLAIAQAVLTRLINELGLVASYPTTVIGPLIDLAMWLKPRTFVNLTDNNPCTGLPSDEVDAAWEALLGDMIMNIRVSAMELTQDDQDSVALPEGGGYLALLGVIHEFHCVVSVGMFLTWKI